MRKNWKTTTAGIGAIATGIAFMVKCQYTEGIAAIMTGIGLIAAKDGNVTGGTTQQ